MKTALGLAQAECANYINGQHLADRPCKLHERKLRCGYFEKAILPLVPMYPKYAGANDDYRKRIPAKTPMEVKGAWTCDCGELMPQGRRMCDICAKNNRRKTYQKARDKKNRTDAQQLSDINPCQC